MKCFKCGRAAFSAWTLEGDMIYVCDDHHTMDMFMTRQDLREHLKTELNEQSRIFHMWKDCEDRERIENEMARLQAILKKIA